MNNTTNNATNNTVNSIQLGFIEAMYFADGTDASLTDSEGFYLDGLFNQDLQLSDNAISNIQKLIDKIIPYLPTSVYALPMERIGNCLYYIVAGHGISFNDEDIELSEEDKIKLDKLFSNIYINVEDNDALQCIEFYYTDKTDKIDKT